MARMSWWNDVRLDTHWQVRCALRPSSASGPVIGKVVAMGIDPVKPRLGEFQGETCEVCGCAIRSEDIADLSKIRFNKYMCMPCFQHTKRMMRATQP